VLEHKNRASKPGDWLMRGVQPIPVLDARFFAGSPIPAFFPSQRDGEETQCFLCSTTYLIALSLAASEKSRGDFAESAMRKAVEKRTRKL